MNEATRLQLKLIVDQASRLISANRGRKRSIEEEILSHLHSAYEQELARLGDEHSAIEAVRQRFGNASNIGAELHDSVPFLERSVCAVVGEKETPMSRILWIASIAVIAAGVMFSFPYRDEVHLCGIALLVGMILRHLCQKENLAARLLGPQWRWWIGTSGIAIGPALILPALAKIRVYHVYTPAFFIALGVGILITLSGVCFVALAINRRRTRIAE